MNSLLIWLWMPAAFLLGSIPFGALIVRWRTGKDVRTMGSGNIGATNVLRTTGKLEAILTLALDILKGTLAVALADWLSGGNDLWMSAAALLVLAGHAFSPWLNFQGGKAVASFLGAFVYLTPLPLISVLLLFVAVVWKSRYISLGSIAAAATFPFAVWLILHPPWPVSLSALLAGALIVWRHRSNWERLRAGTESRFVWNRKR
ncbi:MAG: glycerol-3-phosphate 1-O-acyltransferase PlsY [Bryobacter sp.]